MIYIDIKVLYINLQYKGLCMVIYLYEGFNYCFGYSKIKGIHFTLFYSPLDPPIAVTC